LQGDGRRRSALVAQRIVLDRAVVTRTERSEPLSPARYREQLRAVESTVENCLLDGEAYAKACPVGYRTQ